MIKLEEYNQNLIKERYELINKILNEIKEAEHFIETNKEMINKLEDANKELEECLIKRK